MLETGKILSRRRDRRSHPHVRQFAEPCFEGKMCGYRAFGLPHVEVPRRAACLLPAEARIPQLAQSRRASAPGRCQLPPPQKLGTSADTNSVHLIKNALREVKNHTEI
jgi:hypothetical protein